MPAKIFTLETFTVTYHSTVIRNAAKVLKNTDRKFILEKIM
jgi:hypothetical protein